MYELHSIKQGKMNCSLVKAPLVHHGINFYFRFEQDFYKMSFDNITKKHAWVRCRRNRLHCRFAFKIGHNFETVPFSSKNSNRRFADTVTKDQLLNIANYRFENARNDDENHRHACKLTEKDMFNADSENQAKTSSTQEAKSLRTRRKTKSNRKTQISSTVTSDEMGPIPPELQFLLDQPDVAVDITDSSTEFEFTAEEILSGGVQATLIILPKPVLQTE